MTDTGLTINLLASAKDAKTCAEMMAGSEPWITLRRGYNELYEILTDSSREVYLAKRKDTIVGFIILELSGTLKGYIKSVCVHPEHRGEEIGSTLMRYAEERIFSEAPNVFLLVSSFNQGARRLYRRLGYTEVGELEDYVIRGHSEVLMRKTLGPITEYGQQ
jgi:ribosomal-protein-alanine N-acetyltransferase